MQSTKTTSNDKFLVVFLNVTFVRRDCGIGDTNVKFTPRGRYNDTPFYAWFRAKAHMVYFVIYLLTKRVCPVLYLCSSGSFSSLDIGLDRLVYQWEEKT